MSATTTTGRPARCHECGAEVAPALLACPGCARLVHRDELAKLAADAGAAERAGELAKALGSWRRAIELLPPATAQRQAIDARMKALSAAIDGRAAPPAGASHTGTRAGSPGKKAAGVGILGGAALGAKSLFGAIAANGKLLVLGLMKIPTLLSMLLYLRWTRGDQAGFALGVVACLYVHEMGHVSVLRRYGIEASAPMFVPGFGAFVRLKQYPTDAYEDARTGLAGPLWGLAAAGAAAMVGAATGSRVALAVASVSGSINLFNLIPVWQLDGARGLRALSRAERLVVAGVTLAVALGFREWMPAIVGLVVLVRALSTPGNAGGDRRMLGLFVALVVLLGALARLPSLPIADLGGT